MNQPTRSIFICQHSACKANGSSQVLLEFQFMKLPSDVIVTSTGCQGQCRYAPTVRIMPEAVWYCRVTTEDVSLIVEQHLIGNKLVKAKLNPHFHAQDQSQ